MRNYWQEKRQQQMQQGSKPGSYTQIGSPKAPRMANPPHAGGGQRGIQQQIPVSGPGSPQSQSRSPPGATSVPEHETQYTKTRDLEVSDWAEFPWEMFEADDQDFASWMALEGMDLGLDTNIGWDEYVPNFTGTIE
jgi:hypothetical protein